MNTPRERAAPAGPRDGLPNGGRADAASESPASPRAAGTGLRSQSTRKVIGGVAVDPLQEMRRRLDALPFIPSGAARREIGEDVARMCGVGLDSVNDAWERSQGLRS